MNNLFTPTDYDFMIGKTIREEKLNGERFYEYVEDERLDELKNKVIQDINNNLLWYYLVCDELKRREKENGKNSKTKIYKM